MTQINDGVDSFNSDDVFLFPFRNTMELGLLYIDTRSEKCTPFFPLFDIYTPFLAEVVSCDMKMK